MRLVYMHERVEDSAVRSLFLAGPRPVKTEYPDWRPESVAILERLGFDGTVYLSSARDGSVNVEYEETAEAAWELEHLRKAFVRVFWVPRNLKHSQGLRTNVHFGMFCERSRIVLGYPAGAVDTWYLRFIASLNNIPVFHTLEETLACALERLPLPTPMPTLGSSRP